MMCWEGCLLVFIVVIVIVVGFGILVFIVFVSYCLNKVKGLLVRFDEDSLFFEYWWCKFEIDIKFFNV